jgi:hypothetical protein
VSHIKSVSAQRAAVCGQPSRGEAWRRMTVKPGWVRKRERMRHREPDAPPVGVPGPSEPDAAPARAARPPWELSAAEWRLLAITFVGGFGSIVAAACVIAGAIALARNARTHPQGGLEPTGLLLLLGLVVLLMIRVLRRGFAPSREPLGSVCLRASWLLSGASLPLWYS